MADLSKSLQDYLSKNKATDPLLDESESSESKFSLSGWNPFKKKQQNNYDETGDVANGWFAQAQKDPLCPSLSKKQRILGFVICLLMGTFCFSMACLYIPMLILKARKFAMLYTLGSLFIIGSFSMLWGPMNHVKHLFSMQRLPFTSAYFGTLFATIYCSIWLKSTILTVVFAVIQIIALIWYIMSYIPGGQTGLKFFSKIFYSVASKTTQKILPSKKQRILGFVICLLMGTFCFSMACLYIPMLILKARKFAMLYTLGSLFIIGSFSMLWGPMNHVKHLFSMQRLPFTSAYFGTLFATIYCSIWLKSTILTVVFAVIQIIALIWYIMSYIPGGQTGLKFFSKIFYSVASKTTQKILPSKKQRILGFVICLLMGTFCFSMACLYIPMLILKARKFAMLYTLGSLFIIGSFSMLWGPMNHVKHLFSMQRLPFTSAYFGTLFATIYCSIWLKSTILTVVFAVIQIIALIWYIMSYIPGGQTGLKFFSKIFYSVASKTTQKILPV